LTLPYISIALLAGLLGAIPFGIIVTRILGRNNPREEGSGNIGATNVLRTSGWTTGLLTLAGDILKGLASVAIVPELLSSPSGSPYGEEIAATAAVLGHMYSPFIGFQGGKGVATGLGVFALMMPGPTAGAVIVFTATVVTTKYVSLGSILGVLTVPLLGFLLDYPSKSKTAAALISILIIWKHHSNIGRLIHGKENRFGSSLEKSSQQDITFRYK